MFLVGCLIGLIFTAEVVSSEVSHAQTARIVGLGATMCDQFAKGVRSNPVQRDFLAWAQGFTSGILLGRPPEAQNQERK